MTQTVICPDCERMGNTQSVVTIPDDFDVGDVIECVSCGAQLEIVAKKPKPQVVLIVEEK